MNANDMKKIIKLFDKEVIPWLKEILKYPAFREVKKMVFLFSFLLLMPLELYLNMI